MANFFEIAWFLRMIAFFSFYRITFGRNIESAAADDGKEFWKHSIIYQIYPRSFYDEDGDGVGDLRGIASKADYFVNMGVETVWLSPIFKSPMADFGYDISDYEDIDPIFGTLEDFDYLLEEMHKRDVKVIIDFVPNHTSDQHEWFKMSLQKDPKYKDYYVWSDPLGYNETGDPIPPNNWLSFFRFSAWEWSEERKQFYLHQYLKEQPDLNYRNPEVVKEMKNVVKFWMDKGVDGLRVDAIQQLFEIENYMGVDEPIAKDSGTSDPTQHSYLNHTYTQDLPETLDVVRGWNQLIDEYDDRFMMLEVYSEDISQVMKYYGNDTDPISDFPFNFYFIKNLSDQRAVTGSNLKSIVDMWLSNMPTGRWPNWVLGNHDNSRVASRFGDDLIDAMNILTLLLPGTPVTYYGEEIGMVDTYITFEESRDPDGLNNGPDHYMEFSRDPERTPMQWDASPLAGFTKGNSTWLPINENYRTVNVENEIGAKQSHLKVYRQLAQLRKRAAFCSLNLDFQLATTDALAFIRSCEECDDKYIVVINTSEKNNTVDLTKGASKLLTQAGTVVIRSSTDSREETEIGSTLDLSEISLLGGEGIVLRLTE